MLSPVSHWLLIVIDGSVKSLLLAAVAFALLRLLKIRSGSVRHRVWAGVLCGMLALPVLSRVLPALPLPIDVDLAWLETTDGPSGMDLAPVSETLPESVLAEETTAAEAAPVAVIDSHEATPSPWQTEFPSVNYGQSDPMSFEAETRLADQDIAATPVVSELDDVPSTTPPVAVTPITPWYVPVLRWSPTVIVGAWLCGVLVLLFRLVLGLLATNSIMRRAGLLNNLPALRLASGAGFPATIRESKDIRVPVTIGLLRPTILLPGEWRDWSPEKLDAVMTHETTHVERRDFLFAVLAEMNCCLYWFNPLSWWLKTRLSDLAEEACDDAAIDRTGDPAGYARHLLEVAAAVTRDSGRVCQPGLSMARQSNVEGRIHTILDITRPLSERLTWKATLAIIAVMLPAIALAAALQPGGGDGQPSQTEAVAVVESGEAETEEEPASGSAEEDSDETLSTYTLAGKVVDPDGNPVDGALLYFSSRRTDEPFAVSIADGTFSAAVSDADCVAASSVIAVSPNHEFGFGHSFAGALDSSAALLAQAYDHPTKDRVEQKTRTDGNTIRLVKDNVPVQARIMNQEGQPVVGAHIQVLKVYRGHDGSLDRWRAATSEPDADYSSTIKHLQQCATPSIGSTIAVTKASGDDGVVTVRGLGQGSVALLAIHGPNIASAKRHVVTEVGDPIVVAEDASGAEAGDDGNFLYRPASFTHVAAVSRPIVGRITSRKTKQPVPDCVVRAISAGSGALEGSEDGDGFLSAISGDDGTYRLEGLPLGSNTVSIIPPSDSDLIQIQNQITTKVASQPFERNFYLATGVRIRGRVTDLRTGDAAEGHLRMFAYPANPLLKGNRRIRLSSMDPAYFDTNENGEFEAVVVPGKGVLAFGSADYGSYLNGLGSDKLTGPKMENSPAFSAVPHYFNPNSYAAVHEYDVKEGDAPTADIKVDRGGQAILRVVDEKGQPVSGFHLCGRTGNIYAWETIEDDSCTIGRLSPEYARRVYIWHDETNRAASVLLTLPEGAAEPMRQTVSLQPAGTIRGRVVGRDGKPLKGLRLQPKFPTITERAEPDLSEIGFAPGTWGLAPVYADSDVGKSITDAEGRFELQGILPRLKYSEQVQGPPEISDVYMGFGDGDGPMIRYGMADLFTDVTIKPGEVHDIGTITVGRSKDKTPEFRAFAAGPDAKKAMKAKTVKAKPAATVGGAGFDQSTAVQTTSSREQNRTVGAGPAAEDLSITGRVTVESGNPKTIEVSVHLVSQPLGYGTPRNGKQIASVLTTPGRDFKLTIPARLLPRELNYRAWLSVQAREKPYGNEKKAPLGMAAATIRDVAKAKDIRLHMRTEQPITGRLLTLEGQPVVGGRVRILNITAHESEALDAWLEARRNAPAEDPDMMFAVNAVSMFDTDSPRWKGPQLKPTNFELPIGTFRMVTTNEAGEFQLRGIGRDQMLQVEVSGSQIARTTIDVLARDMNSKQVQGSKISSDGQAVRLERSAERIHGSRFSYVAAPSAPVTGVVRDKVSKEPITGLTISVEGLAGSPMSKTGWMITTTDENGRYTINGLPTAGDVKRYRNRISVTATDQPYISTDFNLPSSPGTDPIEFNIELQRAVLATGRLTDKATGKPIQASLHYTPFSGNPASPNYKRYADGSRYMLGNDRKYVTDSDGRFQIPVIPGRGVIGVMCNDNTFRRAVGIEGIPEFANYLKPNGTAQGFGTICNDYLAPMGMHVVKAIDVPTEGETFNIDLQADAGDSVRLHIAAVDSDGRPVTSKLWVQGAQARHAGTVTTNSFVADVTGLDPGESRRIYIHDEAHTIGVVGDVTARNKDSKIVARPLATVNGQLVGVKGNPLKERSVTAVVADANFYQVVEPTRTDDEGYFELKVPVGGPFNIMTEIKSGTKNARPVKVKTDLMVTDQVVDVGVVRLPGGKPTTPQSSNQENKQPSVAAPSSVAMISATEKPPLHIHGQVVGNGNKGLPNARVRLYRTRGAEFHSWNDSSVLVADLNVDDEGRFDQKISRDKLPTKDGDSQWTNKDWLILVLSARGHVYATRSFSKYGETEPLTVRLRPDVVVRGTLLGIEGQPLAGINVQPIDCTIADTKKLDSWLKDVSSNRSKAGETTEKAGMRPAAENYDRKRRFPSKRDLKLPREAIPAVVTDAKGEFELHGFGADHWIEMRISGPGIVESDLEVLGRDIASILPNGRRKMGGFYGRNFSHITQPGADVFGVVRDAETKEPLPGIRVSSTVLADVGYVQNGYINSITDADGRYRLSGMPVVSSSSKQVNSLGVFPGPKPYILNTDLSIPRNESANPVELNIELKRAVLAKGQLIDRDSGLPVKGKVYYSPFRGNPHIPNFRRYADGITSFIGNGAPYRTDENGRFTIPVIPGRGVLCAKADQGEYVGAFGQREIPELKDGAIQNGNTVTSDGMIPEHFHAMKALEVEANAHEVSVDLQVTKGRSIAIHFVDENNQPLSGVKCQGLTTNFAWNTVEGNTGSMEGVEVGQTRHFFAVHETPLTKRIGRITFTSDMIEHTIQLQRLATITGRLLDKTTGKPMPGYSVLAHFRTETGRTINPDHVSDADGKFKIWLPVGTTYRLSAQNQSVDPFDSPGVSLGRLDIVEPMEHDYGDLTIDVEAQKLVAKTDSGS